MACGWMTGRPDAGDGDRDMDIALPPDPPALEDVSSSAMRAQFQRKGIETLELQGKQPEYEYGFDRSHGKAWRMRILGPKKRGPTEWSYPPSAILVPTQPFAADSPTGMSSNLAL